MYLLTHLQSQNLSERMSILNDNAWGLPYRCEKIMPTSQVCIELKISKIE